MPATRAGRTLKILTDARALLNRPRGWVKGHFEHANANPRHTYSAHCSIGALRVAAGYGAFGGITVDGNPQLKAAVNALQAQLTPDTCGARDLVHFNDAYTTRKKDVIALFDRAIATFQPTPTPTPTPTDPA